MFFSDFIFGVNNDVFLTYILYFTRPQVSFHPLWSGSVLNFGFPGGIAPLLLCTGLVFVKIKSHVLRLPFQVSLRVHGVASTWRSQRFLHNVVLLKQLFVLLTLTYMRWAAPIPSKFFSVARRLPPIFGRHCCEHPGLHIQHQPVDVAGVFFAPFLLWVLEGM